MAYRDELMAAREQIARLEAEQKRYRRRRAKQRRPLWIGLVLVSLLTAGFTIEWLLHTEPTAVRDDRAYLFRVAQRSSAQVTSPGGGAIQVYIGDIKRGRTVHEVTIAGERGALLAYRDRVPVGASITVSLHDRRLSLTLDRIEPHVVTDDLAYFRVAVVSAPKVAAR